MSTNLTIKSLQKKNRLNFRPKLSKDKELGLVDEHDYRRFTENCIYFLFQQLDTIVALQYVHIKVTENGTNK